MKKIIFIVLLWMLTNPQHAFAGEWNKARDLDVDKELSEMKSASVILPPGKHEGGTLHPSAGQIPGQGLSDGSATAKGSGAGIGGANAGAGAGSLTNLGSGDTNSGNGIDANLHAGTGGTEEAVLPDSSSDLSEETPTVGGDVSTGGDDYLISVDASVGDTEVGVDLIPSDSLDNTLVGETTDIGAEIDAGGELSGSEADIGIEADVDGSVSGDDPADDPADGLSLTPSI